MPAFDLADLVAGILLLALNIYVLFGGADFGGGVWDLLARGPRGPRQRDVIAHAIGPVWEANHVWLILVVVLLFTCFSPAFARLAIVLHVPLTLMLVGVVLRGSAFTFRSYGQMDDAAAARWGRVFAMASLITPLLLGVAVGTVASGRVRAPDPAAGFVAGYVSPWLTPFAFATGILAVVLFAFLAAVYLTLETADPELREDFRIRALGSGIAVFAAAALALLLAHDSGGAPLMAFGLLRARWALPLQLGIALAAITALLALWYRRYVLARVAAAVQVSLILWGWGLAQYPYLIPPDLTIEQTAAPAATIRLVLIALAAGAVILLPSLWYLFRIFKAAPGTDRASPAA